VDGIVESINRLMDMLPFLQTQDAYENFNNRACCALEKGWTALQTWEHWRFVGLVPNPS
jgi:hypothetical protein